MAASFAPVALHKNGFILAPSARQKRKAGAHQRGLFGLPVREWIGLSDRDVDQAVERVADAASVARGTTDGQHSAGRATARHASGPRRGDRSPIRTATRAVGRVSGRWPRRTSPGCGRSVAGCWCAPGWWTIRAIGDRRSRYASAAEGVGCGCNGARLHKRLRQWRADVVAYICIHLEGGMRRH